MKTDDTFSFDLSLDELRWLAGAFGIASLPLPDHSQPETSRAQLVEGQKKGHASLLRRGLIQTSPGFGWQVDRLPAAIVQWMSTAESMLRVERIEKNGEKNVIHVFTSNEQALTVEIAKDNAHFVLYRSPAALKESLNAWLKIPPKPGKAKGIFSITQPQTLIPLAWKDSKLAEKILANAGLSQNSKAILEWTTALDWLVILGRLRVNGKPNGAFAQFILCGSEESQWGGWVEKESVGFSAMVSKEVDAAIGKML